MYFVESICLQDKHMSTKNKIAKLIKIYKMLKTQAKNSKYGQKTRWGAIFVSFVKKCTKEPKDDIHLTWGRQCMKFSTVPGCEIEGFATLNKFCVREKLMRGLSTAQ